MKYFLVIWIGLVHIGFVLFAGFTIMLTLDVPESEIVEVEKIVEVCNIDVDTMVADIITCRQDVQNLAALYCSIYSLSEICEQY